jgi:transposase
LHYASDSIDRRVAIGIVFLIRNGLRWRDAPRGYGPHKTIYNRFKLGPALTVHTAWFDHDLPDKGFKQVSKLVRRNCI